MARPGPAWPCLPFRLSSTSPEPRPSSSTHPSPISASDTPLSLSTTFHHRLPTTLPTSAPYSPLASPPFPMDPGSSNPGATMNIKKQEDLDGTDTKTGQKPDQKPVVRTLNRVPRKSPFCILAVRSSDRIHRNNFRCMCEFRGCRSFRPITHPHPSPPQNACRKQKMRCEGAENPPCRRCRHAGLECLFEKPTREASLTGEAGLESVPASLSLFGSAHSVSPDVYEVSRRMSPTSDRRRMSSRARSWKSPPICAAAHPSRRAPRTRPRSPTIPPVRSRSDHPRSPHPQQVCPTRIFHLSWPVPISSFPDSYEYHCI